MSIKFASAGSHFKCTYCNLEFGNDEQLITHEQSKQHLVRTGQNDPIQRASLEDVKKHIEDLAEKKGLKPVNQ